MDYNFNTYVCISTNKNVGKIRFYKIIYLRKSRFSYKNVTLVTFNEL